MQKGEEVVRELPSSMTSCGHRETAVQLDAGALRDFSSHLGSGRVYLRHQLPILARFMRVPSVGTGSPSARDRAQQQGKVSKK